MYRSCLPASIRSLRFPWNAKITVGVNNVFDKNPPIAFAAFANSFDPQYEVPGQFLYMRYAQKF